VLAIAILTAVTLATTLLIVPIARQTRINRETEVATAAAQRVIEKFQATPFHQLVTLYPQGTTMTVPDLPSGSIAVSYADPDADPLLIRVDLSWQSEDLGSMLVNFHTVRTE
jgi:hypothetical protein